MLNNVSLSSVSDKTPVMHESISKSYTLQIAHGMKPAAIGFWTKYKHMLAYALLLSAQGALETFSSALFVEFTTQLNVDTAVIALIFTVKSISFAVSAIFCAFVIDTFRNTHYFVSFSTFLSCITITLIPYIHIVSVMYIAFIIIGFSLGVMFVCLPVYIFRQYPEEQGRILYIVIVIYGIIKTIFPIIVQLSISLTSEYKYSLFAITFLSLLTSVSLFLLATPKHDSYRTLKQDISSSQLIEEKSKAAVLTLSNDKKHIYTQWILIMLFSFIVASFSAVQSGLVNFITSYCDKYLLIGELFGRYMISAYYGGQLFYRLVVAAVLGNEKLKKLYIPKTTILTGFIVMNIFLILFVLFDSNVVLIFAVYTMCGIFGSGIFPDILKWCEQMTPVSGTLSCVLVGGFAFGDAMIVFIIGELFDIFGERVLNYSLLFANIIGTLIVLIAIVAYNKYDKHKTTILCKLFETF